MAEALVAIGTVASVVDLAGKAAKIVKRLYDFQSTGGELAESLAPLWTELPAFTATLEMIEENAARICELDRDGGGSGGGNGGGGGRTAKRVLEPLIRNCFEQINLLEQISRGLKPEENDSRFKKLQKGCRSLRKDKMVEKAVRLLRNYSQTLDFHCLLVLSSSAVVDAQEKKRQEIYHWLSAPDPHVNYHAALKCRHDDTGQWFIQGEEFTQWKDSAGSLWLHGIPGCGKTILASTILENVLSKSRRDLGEVVAFFFFDFNDPRKQTSKLLLHSLVSQISSQTARLSPELNLLFTACRGGERQPTDRELLDVLRDMLESIPRTYIVIDALDECGDRAQLMDIIKHIGAWDAPGLHFLATSRQEYDIERCLRGFIEEQEIVGLQSHLVDPDIRSYVQQRLASDPSLGKWRKDPAIQAEIDTAIMSGAQGMFRWAACQLDSLSKCRNRSMLHKALKSLPPTLDETYDRILCAITENDAEYAYRILYWLTFSKRPLRIEEVAETVAISSDRDPAFDRDDVLEDPHEALDMCLSLVSIVTDEKNLAGNCPQHGSDAAFIVLAHYSVKEYLISKRIHEGAAKRFGMSPQTCHNLIAESCLHYLLEIEEPCVGEADWLDRNALAKYSAITWCHHAQANGDAMADSIHKLIYSLFTSRKAFTNWLRIEKPDEADIGASLSRQLSELPTPIYYACMLGLTRVAEQLITEEAADVNVSGGRFGNPLQAAAISCQENTVRLLIDKGADVNLQGGRHGNAFTAACVGGSETVVKLLLSRGANINATGGRYHTALQAASIEGHVSIVKFLLENGADVNLSGGRYGSALQAASIGGWQAILRLLLDHGANVNLSGGRYGTALQAASIDGHETIVKLLLEHGADASWKGGRYGSALQAASIGGHDGIVRMLLSTNHQQQQQQPEASKTETPKVSAEVSEVSEVSKVPEVDKVDKIDVSSPEVPEVPKAAKVSVSVSEIDVNSTDGQFGSALQAASRRGNESIVRMLLDAGAKVDTQGGGAGGAGGAGGGVYGSAMQEALGGKHGGIVTILESVSIHE